MGSGKIGRACAFFLQVPIPNTLRSPCLLFRCLVAAQRGPLAHSPTQLTPASHKAPYTSLRVWRPRLQASSSPPPTLPVGSPLHPIQSAVAAELQQPPPRTAPSRRRPRPPPPPTQRSGSYDVTSLDHEGANLYWIKDNIPGASTRKVSFTDANAMAKALEGHDAVLAAGPFWHNPMIAEVCKRVGAHYLDLTEDVSVTQKVKELAGGAGTAFIPQCGLAPGFITIAGYNLAKSLDTVSGSASE